MTQADRRAAERPILFSGAMMRAILDGKKTQTRRIVKPPNGYSGPDAMKRWTDINHIEGRDVWLVRGEGGKYKWMPCPYGKRGDRLWVRETFAHVGDGEYVYRADMTDKQIADEQRINGITRDLRQVYRENRWRPSIHMPRAASRITLEITEVRVERLQDISEEDAKAEGCMPFLKPLHPSIGRYKAAYCELWEKINSAGSWDANPWVWVVYFSPVAPAGAV